MKFLGNFKSIFLKVSENVKKNCGYTLGQIFGKNCGTSGKDMTSEEIHEFLKKLYVNCE